MATYQPGLRPPAADIGPRIAVCCAAVIAALYVVGLVSSTELRHIVQTLPLWLGVVMGARKSSIANWLALPMLLFWLVIMVLIWLFLLGIARVVSGTFTPIEVIMTIVIGVASLVGMVVCLSRPRSSSAVAAAVAFVCGAALQYVAFRLSILPRIAAR